MTTGKAFLIALVYIFGLFLVFFASVRLDFSAPFGIALLAAIICAVVAGLRTGTEIAKLWWMLSAASVVAMLGFVLLFALSGV